MPLRRVLPALLAALAFLAPAASHAQRDTIRLGGTPEPRDTITIAPSDTTPAEPERPSRWSRPFAVEGSGEVAPRPPARQIVWLPADSVRARRIAARRAAAGEDSTGLAVADSVAADSSSDTEPADSAPPPPARRAGRNASRDTAATNGRRSTRRAAADTASARRSASDDEDARRSASDDEDADAAPRPTRRASAGRDTTASTRRTSSRDTTSTRRAASRDTASSRRTTGRPRTHTVASGETLFGIARRYGVTTAQLRAVNPDLGETLEIGDVLRLPAGARAPGQPARTDDSDRPATRRASSDDDDERPAATRRPSADRDAAPRPSARTRRHTVAAGETLYGIARKYGVTVDAIRRANRLESDTVRPGQALTIPAAAPPQR